MLLKKYFEVLMKQIYFSKSENTDIFPIQVGQYQCPSLNTFGPYVRDYHIVHFVLSGKGVLINSRGTHTISAGEMFVIREGELTTYVADKDDPWLYTWIGFSGKRKTLFDDCPDVIKTPGELDMKLSEYVKRGDKSPDIFLSILYELMYNLFDEDSKETVDDRIRNVHRHLKYNYMEEISIVKLAASYGFERSYLYRIFKRRYGIGPKEYLTRVRMEKAKWLLERGYSVAEAAYMLGYSDAFSFSKAYKNHYGVAPSLDTLM